ncbi:MAG: tetratricopeptide repeat protein [Acidobacteriota bacterium]
MLVLSVLLIWAPLSSRAQWARQPQAETPEEFDAYLLVVERTAPKERITAALEFERKCPHSAMLAAVYEMQMEACRAIGDSEGAIRAGELALQEVPNNLVVLTQLAYLLANSATERGQLARAEELARNAIATTKKIRLPKWIDPVRWEETQGRLGSTAHSALGLVAYKHGKTAKAIAEFEAAVSLAPTPDPALHYRLGLLFKLRGDPSRAIQELQKAADSTEPTLRRLAEAELRALQRGGARP